MDDKSKTSSEPQTTAATAPPTSTPLPKTQPVRRPPPPISTVSHTQAAAANPILSSPRVPRAHTASYDPGPVTSFIDALFQTPSSSRDKSLQTANEVIAKMHEMLTERDAEIEDLKELLQDERRKAVQAEITFLTARTAALKLEYSQTMTDLGAKRRQLAAIDGVTFEDVYGQDVAVTLTGSVLPGNLENSVASVQPVQHNAADDHDHYEFDDAMEDHDGEDVDDEVDSVFEKLGGGSKQEKMMEKKEKKQEEKKASIEEFLHTDPAGADTLSDAQGDPSKEEGKAPLENEPSPPPKPKLRHPELSQTYNIVDNYDPSCLFAITKSANDNTVVYAANFAPGGKSLQTTEPCKPYWIMFSNPRDPGTGKAVTEELNYIEKNTAYGVTCEPDPGGRAGHYECAVASLNDRKFDIYVDEATGTAVARTVVGGKRDVHIKMVRVQMADSWIPSVKHVDITGVTADGELVTERKIP